MNICGSWENTKFVDMKMVANLLSKEKMYKPLDAFQIILGMIPQNLEPDLLSIPIKQDPENNRIQFDAFQIFSNIDQCGDISVNEFNQYSTRGLSFLKWEMGRFQSQNITCFEYLRKYGVNIEAVNCCIKKQDNLKKNINTLYRKWRSNKRERTKYPLSVYLDWVVDSSVGFGWTDFIVDNASNLLTAKLFKQYFKRPIAKVPKWPLFERLRKREECPVCYIWKEIKPISDHWCPVIVN